MFKGDLSLSVPALVLSPSTTGDPRGRWAVCSSPTATIKAKQLYLQKGVENYSFKLKKKTNSNIIMEAWNRILLLIYVFEVSGTKRCPVLLMVPLPWADKCSAENRTERENTQGTIQGLSQVSTELCPQQLYLSVLHSLGKVSDNGFSIQALTRRYLQNYLQNLQRPSLSHCEHICLTLVWNTRRVPGFLKCSMCPSF